MMSGGPSDRTVARLMRLEMLGSLGDSDAAMEIKLFLERRRGRDRDDRDLDLVKMLQAFINPSMYSEVYEDEVKQDRAPVQVEPTADMLEQARRMMSAFSKEDADHTRREAWMTDGGQKR